MKRICYVSEATSTPPQLWTDVRDILSEARHFNHLHGIVGVLYFADGQFFQCLEGRSQDLDLLLDKLHQDSRHHQIQLFDAEDIDTARFDQWSMKYVTRASQIQQFFKTLGFEAFSPRLLNPLQLSQFLEVLYQVKT